MPVSTGSDRPSPAKRCKHCEESGHRVDNGNLFWRIQLDQDLLDTIVAIYPEWFKDYNLNRTGTMAEGGIGPTDTTLAQAPSSTPGGGSSDASPSPAAAEVDDSPLHNAMDRNKESLKVKLMMRRPINQLVAQGIMPSLKTPPAFHEQRQKLERAKMGDLLKAKIQQRPDRQELVRQHILEDVGHVDPSLAERQRMLKKARLADSLNDQLSHRPGPLELIKKNILHTEEPIERLVKEGAIPFKATCEGQLTKPQHPNQYITFEEDSQSSEGGAQSPQSVSSTSTITTALASNTAAAAAAADVLEAAAASAGIVTVALTIPTSGGAVVVTSPASFQAQNHIESMTIGQQTTVSPATTVTFADLYNSVAAAAAANLPAPTTATVTANTTTTLQTILPLAPAPSPLSLGSSTSSLSPLSSVASPTPSPMGTAAAAAAAAAAAVAAQQHRSDAPGKDKNRKKSKSKSQPKTRTIKFHEYKGPPNAHKNQTVSSSPVETSYELLLQQQQLFLQWQLEWQHKYPQIILPAAQKPPIQTSTITTSGNTSTDVAAAIASGLIAVTSPPPPPPPPPQPSQQPIQQIATVTIQQQLSPQQTIQEQSPISIQQNSTQSNVTVLGKLEDMKVSDLKAELKRRNLPVSGPKPQLIERLKPYLSDQIQQPATPATPLQTDGSLGPASVMSEESLSGGSASTDDDLASMGNMSPVSLQQMSPVGSPQEHRSSITIGVSDSPQEMDTSENQSSPASPPCEEDLIRDQERKIKELERELHRSQLQLQQFIGNKNQKLKLGLLIDTQNGNSSQKTSQKQALQQHLQNKKQQQHIQAQLQQLQQLQQQQLQRQHQIFQEQQKQQKEQQQISLQIKQPGSTAKASLAAFLQSQSLQQQQQQTNNNNIILNNKNSNNNNNNRKNGTLKGIVIGQQQATALLLNQMNLQKQKAALSATGNANNNIVQQRTTSLPTFFSAYLPTATATLTTQTNEIKQEKPEIVRAATETFLAITTPTAKPPPPEYEEAAKLLKVKQETPSSSTSDSNESSKTQKNVKSQIVDDVLEILIKNGELPPSAAQDPATPTTPGQTLPNGLIFATTASSTSAPPPPPPPPPPPLPQTTFAITLPNTIALTTLNSNDSEQSNTFQMQFSDNNLDFILDTNSSDDQSGDVSQDNRRIDLKELGLDLETMDFSQLDCDSQVMDMDIGGSSSINDELPSTSLDKADSPEEIPCEFMDIGEMPMDMDDQEWLDSFLPNESHVSSVSTPPPSFSDGPNCEFSFNSGSGTDLDTYDQLLSNSQDPFDLFNIGDSEFKIAGDLSSGLVWDKLDFAT